MRRALVAAFLLVLALLAATAHAARLDAVLDHADSDIKRIFFGSTTYRVRAISLDKEEAPLTFYVIYRGSKFVGLIHGTAAESKSGPMQVFVAYRSTGQIGEVYVQRISSSHAPHFRSDYYLSQFRRFGLNEAPDDAYVKPPVRMPPKDVLDDHQTLIKAVQMNIDDVKRVYNRIKE